MRKFIASLSLVSCVFLTGCESNSSISIGGGSGTTVTLSGAVSFVKDAVHSIVNAGSIVVGTVQSVRNDISTRVDKVQEGAKKIQEGRDLIEEGIGNGER